MPFTWFTGYPPPDLEIKQVYGLIFTECERLLLFIDGSGAYSLPGGTPESYDCGIEDTLRREIIEEVNTVIGEPVIVGYQIADEENGTPLYAQVRMTAMIREVKPPQPDPATGITYKRVLATPAKAIELLKWYDTGALQVNAAVKTAREIFKIGTCSKCFDNADNADNTDNANEEIFI